MRLRKALPALGGAAVLVSLLWPWYDPAATLEPVGAYIALGAALLAWIGAWLSLRDESTLGAVAPLVPVRHAD